MNFSKGFFYGALTRLIALVVSETGSQNYGAVDYADHFEDTDAIRISGKFIAAIGALDAQKKTSFTKLLQDLRKNRQRDMVGFADFFGASRTITSQSEMAESDQAVVGFFGELEHWILDCGLKLS